MKRGKKKWLFWILAALLIPYGITMVMTGVIGTSEIPENYQAGIVISYIEYGKVKTIDLEDYVIGILASQISADFESEALKGQAIIIRTNVLNEMEKEKTKNGEELPFLYLSKEEMKEKWGEKNWEKYYKRLKKAVANTAGIYMTYDGEYIEAYYHPVSIGMTVSAEELLGKTIPYLQSVNSSKDVESKDYMNITEWEYIKIQQKLAGHKIKVDIQTLKESLRIEEKTKLGYVTKMIVGNQEITGSAWAEYFELPSTNFYLEDYNGKLRIICLGKGRGLGLSQYGANEMAKNGSTYEEILNYYYQEIQLNKIVESGNAIARGDKNEKNKKNTDAKTKILLHDRSCRDFGV